MNQGLRLDKALVERKLVKTRSSAENLIKLNKVSVDNKVISTPGRIVYQYQVIKIMDKNPYVSRAAYKLESVYKIFNISFKDMNILDVGSSTGGFIDFSLRMGAKKVVGIEVGSNQLDKSLIKNPRVLVYEKTDIRNVFPKDSIKGKVKLDFTPDIILIDVSFISLEEILLSILKLANKKTYIFAMVKPQFETKKIKFKHKGVVKNENIRRKIFKNFEAWISQYCQIINKADSQIFGSKGNKERFYVLKLSNREF